MKNYIANMSTVAETELEQRIGELVQFIRDYAVNHDKDFLLNCERDGFKFSIFDKDVTIEFQV